MRILASTGPLFARPLDWALAIVAEAGYDGAELMVTQDPGTQEPERVIEASRTEGLAVPVVHGPFLLITRRVFGTDLVTKAERSVELAGAIGADLMIAHPPFRWQRAFHRWLLEEGDGEAAAHGTRVGVENLYPVTVRGRPVRFHRYTEPEHLLSFTNVVLDTSHLGVAGVDLLEAYETLRGRISHLHVSDYRGEGHDSHAPLGHGILPLGRFLHRVGRDADTTTTGDPEVGTGQPSITLELDCRPYIEDRAALVGYLRQERQKCEALVDGAAPEEVLGRPDDVSVAPGAGEGEHGQPTVGPVRR